MSAFSKKYYPPKGDGEYLAVSWDVGYKNIVVYHKGRLVCEIPRPSVLVDGIKVQDPELGEIKFQLTTTRPTKIEIKVNKKKYKTINKIKLSYYYGGLVTVFTTLSVFACFELLVLVGSDDFSFAYQPLVIYFVIDLAIVITYGTVSFLLGKRKPYAYFVGTTIFLATTAYVTFGPLFSTNFFTIFILFVRCGILTYLILQAKHILKEIDNGKPKNVNEDLLDRD